MDCPICSTQCHSFTGAKENIEYFRCENCDLIFKSPDNFQDFDEQKKRYDLHQNSEDNIGYRDYFNRFADFIFQNIKIDIDSALDFGCGESILLSRVLNERGVECDVYDPIYHPDERYRDQKYDLIVSVEVFEHLHHPLQVFSHLLERLNDGGYLAIRTEFHPESESDFLKWYYRMDPTHIMFYSLKTFSYLAGRFGLDLVADNGKNIVILEKD